MKISAFEWDEHNIGHIAGHNVSPEEVEESCNNRPFILRGRDGLYIVYSQTDGGRFLLTVFRHRNRGIIRVITARDMTEREKRFCKERRK